MEEGKTKNGTVNVDIEVLRDFRNYCKNNGLQVKFVTEILMKSFYSSHQETINAAGKAAKNAHQSILGRGNVV